MAEYCYVGFRVKKETKEKLKEIATRENKSVSKVLNEILENALKQQ